MINYAQKTNIVLTILLCVFIMLCSCNKTDLTTTSSSEVTTQQEVSNQSFHTAINDNSFSTAIAKNEETTKQLVVKPKPSLESTSKSERKTVSYTFAPSDFDKYDNNSSYDEDITVLYDESKILNDYLYYWYFPNYSGDGPVTYEQINKEYPVECIRKCNENIYAVYKTKQGGLMYMFFTLDINLFYSAYSKKNIRSTDFQSIKSESSFDEVVAIDPAARAMKTAYEHRSNSTVFYTAHILSDGLFIVYYNKSDSGKYTVWKAEYLSDYVFNNHDFFYEIKPEFAVDHTDYSYKILNKDHIAN